MQACHAYTQCRVISCNAMIHNMRFQNKHSKSGSGLFENTETCDEIYCLAMAHSPLTAKGRLDKRWKQNKLALCQALIVLPVKQALREATGIIVY